MAEKANDFYDVYTASLNRQGEELCGDQVKILRTADRTLVVLSDGLGSGVKASILATLTTEIIMTMLRESVPLKEIIEMLDTGANSFSAKWASDSKKVTIIYRVDRHAPLKAVKYMIAGRRARCIKGPFNVTSEELAKYWRDHSSGTAASPRTFGTPLHRPLKP